MICHPSPLHSPLPSSFLYEASLVYSRSLPFIPPLVCSVLQDSFSSLFVFVCLFLPSFLPFFSFFLLFFTFFHSFFIYLFLPFCLSIHFSVLLVTALFIQDILILFINHDCNGFALKSVCFLRNLILAISNCSFCLYHSCKQRCNRYLKIHYHKRKLKIICRKHTNCLY